MATYARGIQEIRKNINSIYDRRRAAVYALCLRYAHLVLRQFRDLQRYNAFWQNQTGQARDTVFSKAYIEENVIGFFLAHAVKYGVYLELANDRVHEAIRPIIRQFAGSFYKDLKRIYSDAA